VDSERWAEGSRHVDSSQEASRQNKAFSSELGTEGFVLFTDYCLLSTLLLPNRRVGNGCRLRGIDVNGVAV